MKAISSVALSRWPEWLFLSTFLLLFVVFGCESTAQHDFRADYEGGLCAEWVAAGDLNGDGIDDAVVAAPSEAAVVIYLGQGDGTLELEGMVPLNGHVRGLALKDLDRDGDLDLVAVSGVPSLVAVAKGDGRGKFTSHGTYGIPALSQTDLAGPDSVSIGDLNGDGFQDLIIGRGPHAMDTTVAWLEGVGGARFDSAEVIEVGGIRPRFSVLADVTGDDTPDLVTVLAGSNLLSVVELGDGGEVKGVRLTVATGRAPAHLATGDFNGDGRADFVVANSGEHSISIFLGNKIGLAAALTVPVQRTPQAVLISDFDRNGTHDIAVAASENDFLTLLSGDGRGAFGAPRHFPAGHCANSLASADLHGTGIRDQILIANCGKKSLSAFHLPHPPKQLTETAVKSLNDGDAHTLALRASDANLAVVPTL
jgi:hypothetical protein